MTSLGGAPSLSVSVNPATNQISPTNIAYDGNGNVTQFGPSGSLTTMAYDVSNRLAAVNSNNAYAYSSTNQRVYFRNSAGTETLYVYGEGGKKVATHTVSLAGGQVSFSLQSQNVYFAGKLVSAEGNAVAVDRLGSVRWNAAGGGHTYYPYGAEYAATAGNTEKYATYTRDSLTGLDYAMNRYYASFWGRFTSPDRAARSMRLAEPQTLNRYVYASNDPVNRRDPTGLDDGSDGSLFDWGDPSSGLVDGSLFGDGDDNGGPGLQGCGPIYLSCVGGTATPDPNPTPDPTPVTPDPPPPPPPPTPAPQQPIMPPPSICTIEPLGQAAGPHSDPFNPFNHTPTGRHRWRQ